MNTDRGNKPALFQETQKFRQPWLWGLVLLPTIGILAIILYQLITGQPVGDKPAPTWLLLLLLVVIPMPLVVGFYIAQLTLRVEEEGIYYGWNLFGSKQNRLPWNEIHSLMLIRYKLLGSGVSLTRKYGTVHSVRGDVGLFLETRRGRKLTIGTNKPDELDRALREIAAQGVPMVYADARAVMANPQSAEGFPPGRSRSYS